MVVSFKGLTCTKEPFFGSANIGAHAKKTAPFSTGYQEIFDGLGENW
jgi:hypothetical protein